jgi:hypothetical protein
MNPLNCTLTIHLPIQLKQRIDAAADKEERSTSKYLSMLLERIIPPGDAPAQKDIEHAISEQVQAERYAAKQLSRIRKVVDRAHKAPARGK